MYDRNGILQAAGAETLLDTNIEKAETEGWFKAEWQVICTKHCDDSSQRLLVVGSNCAFDRNPSPQSSRRPLFHLSHQTKL
jgi:hypothetical protein